MNSIFSKLLNWINNKCDGWLGSYFYWLNILLSGEGPVSAAPILPLIPPQSAERWKSQDTDLIRIFLDVLLELMVSQVILVEWRDEKALKQKRAFNFLFEKFKTFYMPAIFPDFNWHMSLYKPSLELPEVRKFRPNFVDTGDGTKKMDPMLACRVVVIKWVAQYVHLVRGGGGGVVMGADSEHNTSAVLNISGGGGQVVDRDSSLSNISQHSGAELDTYKANTEGAGQLVRDILYGTRHNVNFIHEVFRQAFLLSFSHSPAMKRVITVYKDWIQMNVQVWDYHLWKTLLDCEMKIILILPYYHDYDFPTHIAG